MQSIRQEVASVSNQDDQTALYLWEPPDIGVFQPQRSYGTDYHTNEQAGEEDKQENANALKEVEGSQVASPWSILLVSLRSFEEHNCDRVVQD